MADKNSEEMFDANIFTLTDEEGNELEFEEIATYEEEGTVYHAMIPCDSDADEAEMNYVILKSVVGEDGETWLETIDDDDEFDRIADIFDDGFSEIDYD